MRFAFALALSIAGCASPQRIEEGAMRHEAAARAANERGDYERAVTEQEAADKQYRKAQARRAGYPYY